MTGPCLVNLIRYECSSLVFGLFPVIAEGKEDTDILLPAEKPLLRSTGRIRSAPVYLVTSDTMISTFSLPSSHSSRGNEPYGSARDASRVSSKGRGEGCRGSMSVTVQERERLELHRPPSVFQIDLHFML